MATVSDHLPAETLSIREHNVSQLELEIDNLLAKYLDLLDAYSQAREELSRNLSEGFMSLASANFTAPRGVRYGQDFYDDRMLASRTAQFVASDSNIDIIIKEQAAAINDASNDQDNGNDVPSAATHDGGIPESEARSSPSREEIGNDRPLSEDETKNEKKAHLPCRDPLKWFGAFVPPKLRATQSHFATVLDSNVVRVDNVNRRMINLEIEIRRHRKRLAKHVQ